MPSAQPHTGTDTSKLRIEPRPVNDTGAGTLRNLFCRGFSRVSVIVSYTSVDGTVLHSQWNPTPSGTVIVIFQSPGLGSLTIRHRTEEPDITTNWFSS